jgi:hypothetical protein
MTPMSSEPRRRRAPIAECRLCSAVCSIEAPTTDALRLSLRAFMAEHRHNGLADIVIDISDEDDDPGPAAETSLHRVTAGDGVSGR